MDKSQILHVVTHFSPFIGGLENLVKQLGEAQTKNFAVTVLTLQYDKSLPREELIEGIKVIRFPAFNLIKGRYSFPCFGFSKQIKRLSPDLIFTHTRFFQTSFLAGRVAQKLGIKWIHVEHGQNLVRSANFFIKNVAYLFDVFFGKWIFKKADKIVVLSEKAKQFVCTQGALLQNVVLIKNGVKIPQKILPLPRKNKALFLGRKIQEKGYLEVMEAAKKCPNWDFEFISDLDPVLVSDKIQSFDLVVLPSYSEGSSLVTLEAAANRRSVLATDVGNNAEIVLPEFLIKIKDVNSLVEKLNWLENNFEVLATEGEKNYKKVVKSFHFDRMVDAYEVLIKKVLET